MSFSPKHITYHSTGYFSKIVQDLIAGEDSLQPFISFEASINGIKEAINARKNFSTNRTLLVNYLKEQYLPIGGFEKVNNNIELLLDENTFTICTAHQPNIFTGHLYFIYKILHAVKLAAHLEKEIPGSHFVPVYYMGSEDADLEELGHVFINGQKHEWHTNQTGAVGRMKVDKDLINMIDVFAGELNVHPHGETLITLLKACYKEGDTLEMATFRLVNELFSEFGLIVLLPDHAKIKKVFIPVFEKELKEQFSHVAVADTISAFPRQYKLQASGRELNLFYLINDKRERIVLEGEKYFVQSLNISFSLSEIMAELQEHPERFSPNVILRPVFQETILPNIAFIGGGGEMAYWLELKKVFESVGVPYPVLILRNSFLIIEKHLSGLMGKLGFTLEDIFKTENELLTLLTKRETKIQLSLEKEKLEVALFYKGLKETVKPVDITLQQHIDALQKLAEKKITALEKKMLRAEKKKFEAQQRQIHKLKQSLFPNNNLQERVENILPYYSKFGKGFLELLYLHSLNLEQEFVLLSENPN